MSLTTPPPSTAPPTTEATPFYQEAAFIIGMVVLAVVIVLVLCALFLCLARPKQRLKYNLKSPPTLEPGEGSPAVKKTPSRNNYSKLSPSPRHTTASWSPGQPMYSVRQYPCSWLLYSLQIINPNYTSESWLPSKPCLQLSRLHSFISGYWSPWTLWAGTGRVSSRTGMYSRR